MFESRHTEVEEIVSFSGFNHAERVMHERAQDYLVKFIKMENGPNYKSSKDNLYG